MGIYLNPGSRRFQMALDSEIYVDKTEMISCLNMTRLCRRLISAITMRKRFRS